jgi:hypothetical protein
VNDPIDLSPPSAAVPDSRPEVGESFLTPVQLSRLLGISIRTLGRWHAEKRGPARISIGQVILYRASAVRAWLRHNEFQSMLIEGDQG